MTSILLPRDLRQSLATFLADRRIQRPPQIPAPVWGGLVCASVAALDLADLRAIFDDLDQRTGQDLLDLLSWPAFQREAIA